MKVNNKVITIDKKRYVMSNNEIYRNLNFIDQDFSGVKLVGAKFVNCTFINVNFSNAIMHNIIIDGCKIRKCDFSQCDISTNVHEAIFTGLNQIGKTFMMHNKLMQGLTKAHEAQNQPQHNDESFFTYINKTTIDGCIFNHTNLTGARVKEVSFMNTEIKEVNLTLANIERLIFTNSKLTKPTLHNCVIADYDVKSLGNILITRSTEGVYDYSNKHSDMKKIEIHEWTYLNKTSESLFL